jgi:hypothetical protein
MSKLRASVTTHRVRSPLEQPSDSRRVPKLSMKNCDTTMRRVTVLLVVAAAFTGVPALVKAQALADASDPSTTVARTVPARPVVGYTRPTQKIKLHNYLFDAFGPYPIAGVAVAAGVNQVENAPPEWKQGAEGYGKRFASDFGIATVTTTTRYALAQAFREDTLYYRCECGGVFPRFSHAVISTFTGRRGEEGHRVFSFPALVAPYAGSMTAVYGWYPGRYDARDGFRMGNYSLLAYVGGNVAREFLHKGRRSRLSRMHPSGSRGPQNPGSNP